MKRSTVKKHAADTITKRVEIVFADDPKSATEDERLTAAVNVIGVSEEATDTLNNTSKLLHSLPRDEMRDRLARALEEFIQTWELSDDDGSPVEPSFAELSTWDRDELLVFVIRLGQAVQRLPFSSSQSSGS